MEANMMMQDEDTLQKVLGDPASEAPEAVYRLAANLIVTKIVDNVIESIADSNVKDFLDINKHLSQFVVGFVSQQYWNSSPCRDWMTSVNGFPTTFVYSHTRR